MYMFAACGAWLIGLGGYFIWFRPPLLPEDLRYIGIGIGDLPTALPGLAGWAHRVFTVMGGFMAGAGVLTIALALTAPAARAKGVWIALALAGLLTVGTMSLTNLKLDSDFKWLLMIPSVLWSIALVLLASRRRSVSEHGG